MNALLLAGLVLLFLSVLGGAAVSFNLLGLRWTRGWTWLLDGGATIGTFLLLIGGARAIIEWWPR